MKLEVKNYRPFGKEHPLKLELEDGITALIGINNSGKSFILKFFFELRNLFQTLVNANSLLSGGIDFSFNTQSHIKEIFYDKSDDPLVISLKEDNCEIIISIHNETRRASVRIFVNGSDMTQGAKITGARFVNENGTQITEMDPFIQTFLTITKCRYYPAFRNAVNIGTQQDYFDLSTGEAFIAKWHNTQISPDPQFRMTVRQVTKDLRELFAYDEFSIDADPNGKRMFVNINGKSLPLEDLGSGLTQFILIFINAALFKPTFILIDEPELNLHPKLQLDFINRLLSYCENGIIFATHNIGLAHSVAQRIYSVMPSIDNSGSVMRPYEKTSRFPEFLGELNFSNYPSLGYDKVLLVEGPTDVIVFSVFLRKIGIYKDVLIWPLGGSSMINGDTAQQLEEIKRLGPNVQIKCWIDSDKASENAEIKTPKEQFKRVTNKLGIETTISERRAIENYFPHEAIQKVFPSLPNLGKFDTIPKGTWVKGSNWRIAQETDIKDLEDCDLGKFLNEL